MPVTLAVLGDQQVTWVPDKGSNRLRCLAFTRFARELRILQPW
jgi:hypothetical protein